MKDYVTDNNLTVERTSSFSLGKILIGKAALYKMLQAVKEVPEQILPGDITRITIYGCYSPNRAGYHKDQRFVANCWRKGDKNIYCLILFCYNQYQGWYAVVVPLVKQR